MFTMTNLTTMKTMTVATMMTMATMGKLEVIYTRSYAALRAADLDWIVGPGYSPGG